MVSNRRDCLGCLGCLRLNKDESIMEIIATCKKCGGVLHKSLFQSDNPNLLDMVLTCPWCYPDRPVYMGDIALQVYIGKPITGLPGKVGDLQ